MNIIDTFLANNRTNRPTIYCIGDAMVDEYYNGVVNRISPEFPMSIMTSTEDEPIRRPGGVANVAYQFRNFNVDCSLIAFADSYSHLCFAEHNLGFQGQRIEDRGGQIPIKRRFLASGIQVFRHDIEKPFYGLNEDVIHFQREAIENTRNLPVPNVAILSDYNKGFFSDRFALLWNELFRYYRADKAITIVDPKTGPVSKWSGCSIFKPNAKEAREMTGETDLEKQVESLRFQLGSKSKIAITMGGDGVAGWDETYFHYKPSRKVQAESVIGAGDCFVAMLALATAYGMPLVEAVEVAYRAGEIYVQNRFNRPIVPAELSTSKIIKPEDLSKRDFKLVFTNGCYDILHPGHYSTLDFAKSKGEKLLVALNSDDSVRRLKGESRPINNLSKRLQMVSRLDMVDFVMAFDEDTPLEVIKRCMPDVLIKGGDYTGKSIVGDDIIDEVYYAPLVDGESTTAVVNRLSR